MVHQELLRHRLLAAKVPRAVDIDTINALMYGPTEATGDFIVARAITDAGICYQLEDPAGAECLQCVQGRCVQGNKKGVLARAFRRSDAWL